MAYFYEFSSLSIRLSEVIGPLDESSIDDFLDWKKNFESILTNMKETVGWSLDSKVFKREASIYRIENMLLKKLVKLKPALIAISTAGDIADRYFLLLHWFAASVHGQTERES
jgi:hypothetical protein